MSSTDGLTVRPVGVVLAGVVAAIVLSACGDSVGAPAPGEGLPVGLEPCAEVTPGDAERCLDAIEATLNADTLAWADGGIVTHDAFGRAYEPVAAALSLLDVTTEFSYDTPLADDGAPTSTDPISTTWSVAGARRTLWTCFDGDRVRVSPAICT